MAIQDSPSSRSMTSFSDSGLQSPPPHPSTPASQSAEANDARARALRALESGPASFSQDRRYRYALWRTWDRSRPPLMVIGLNPSTADEHKLDPTLRRCAGFAYDWDLGGLVMTNLFAFRATDPKDMKLAVDPIGPLNDERLVRLALGSPELTFGHRPIVLAAWGTHGDYLGRDAAVVKLLTTRGVNLHCLVRTKGGFPKHPLYVKRDTQPQIFHHGFSVGR